ncbi:MAG: N-acetylmuramic acid 6-phosphate etherase [Candidatus Eremiobacter antarcticus]|nr:N-acetylmuramic acid 6-phosphate etherase [Candidatus Eremiobacteraeota bacterium]MBC5808701.1 N-acetylmuramic acid 6-phosphate etherase [Candidatus Eremiobacteraeota bacterium]PZR62180.1 MAG: N-acetylmuramic acid 6-phosphate etherase [Candidatus Eremiobacter sp. RRmetagenome_bin22]
MRASSTKRPRPAEKSLTAVLPLTEEVNASTRDLDVLDTPELLHRINDEDRRVAWAVEREIDVIATAVDAITQCLKDGGKLHYFGAGTSGRIGALDAAEIPPTFSAHDVVIAHIAGGPPALLTAVEEAEDDEQAGRREVEEHRIGRGDAVIGISASGSAPYVVSALTASKASGALTVALTNSPASQLAAAVDIPIELLTGPEVIAGSTRLKAGSAQKMALAMMSTAIMTKLGKVYGNLMVDVRPTNKKLRARAERLTVLLSGAQPSDARSALERSGYRVKLAVAMLACGLGVDEAEAALARNGGNLRALLNAKPLSKKSAGR